MVFKTSISKEAVQCFECGSAKFIEYGEMMVCQNCGLVLTSQITGQAIETLPKFESSKKGIDPSLFQTYDGKPKEEGEAFKKWQKLFQVSDATEKNLASAFFEITRIGNTLAVSKEILEVAASIYKKAVEKRLTKRRPIRTLSAAIVYMACRQCGIPITLKEVAYAAGAHSMETMCGYRFLMRRLKFPANSFDVTQYANRLANQLSMHEIAKEIVHKIIGIAKCSRFSQGKNPIGLVAAACYIACILTEETKPQREIAEIAHVTEATIRNQCKELAKNLLFMISL
jgi:transcription initiation factor TFIIB